MAQEYTAEQSKINTKTHLLSRLLNLRTSKHNLSKISQEYFTVNQGGGGKREWMYQSQVR